MPNTAPKPNHQPPRNGQVHVRHYHSLEPSEFVGDHKMRLWPVGKQLVEVLEQEGGMPLRQHHEFDDDITDEEFIQAAVRWSLLKKYGHCPKHLEHPYSSTNANNNNNNNNNIVRLQFTKQDIQTIASMWDQQCALAKSSSPSDTVVADEDDTDLRQFLSTAMSNNRTLSWSIMDCGPATRFQLHAHPNLEIVYCVHGELHEIRMEGKPITTTFEKEQVVVKDDSSSNEVGVRVAGPDISSVGRPWKFATLPQGDFLINEVGSIHRSFTATNGNGCKLFVLWGGSHADITAEREPTGLSVQEAIDTVDKKLCDCGSNASFISETFLPASERSTTT